MYMYLYNDLLVHLCFYTYKGGGGFTYVYVAVAVQQLYYYTRGAGCIYTRGAGCIYTRAFRVQDIYIY